MKVPLGMKRISAGGVTAWLIPLVLFWVVLAYEVPYSFTQYFHLFYPGVFIAVLILFYSTFRLRMPASILTGFGLLMVLLALTLSYLWTTGFSDNFLIGGLLPYKDAKNYYLGADLLLHGLPIRVAGQALGRPLFPGFLSSLLLLTSQNLKLVLALMVQLAGIGLYFSTCQVRRALGAFAGAVYITFMYVYFQPIAGYTMSESLGFIAGCFGFALLWIAAERRKWFDFLLGLGVLMVAVSARAGAFFIFPMLALWAGRSFRGTRRYALLPVLGVLVFFVAGFIGVNTVYPRLLGVPEGSSFGNFAYTLYGQVRGGIGWHSAIDELGTRNLSRVYQATWEVFRTHPSGFLEGVTKAYADFFLPGAGTIFPFMRNMPGLILWFLTILTLLRGLYLLVFKFRTSLSTLFLVGFFGIFLSIPFLPPIDGGSRFYASTMPFFFAPLALGAGRFSPEGQPAATKFELSFLRFASVSLLALTVLLPPVTLRVSQRPAFAEPTCSPEQRPFIINIYPGSYMDLVQSENASCGLAPNICRADFLAFNTEKHLDDFYQELISQSSTSQTDMRIIPTLNLLDGNFQYFVTTDESVLDGSQQLPLKGCAARILTENQRIFRIESLSSSGE